MTAPKGPVCPRKLKRSDLMCRKSNCQICLSRRIPIDILRRCWIKEMNDADPIINVTKSANKMYWMRCKECLHPHHIIMSNFIRDSGCEFCKNRTCRTDISCSICEPKRIPVNMRHLFMSDLNDGIDVLSINTGSARHYYFRCKNCPHVKYGEVRDFIECNGCKFCAHNGVVCNDYDCAHCQPRRFSNHPKSIYWDYSANKHDPRDFSLRSNTSHSFICPDCSQSYRAILNSIHTGNWCGCLRFRTEHEVLSYIRSIFSDYKVIHQFHLEGLGRMRYDIGIPHLNIIVEIDGPQHFEQISNWEDPSYIQQRDIEKMKVAHSHRYTMIRIYQPDISREKIDWRNILIDLLHIHDSPMCIFISLEDVYSNTHLPAMTEHDIPVLMI